MDDKIAGFWTPSAEILHKDCEQKKRQASGSRIELDRTFLDVESRTVVVKDYVVSLDACTCRDFALRRLPCKHMYRLAAEFGVFDLKTELRHGNRYPAHSNVWVADAATLGLAAQYLYRRVLAEHLRDQDNLSSTIYVSCDPRVSELLSSGLAVTVSESANASSVPPGNWREMVEVLNCEGVAYQITPRRGRRADMVLSDAHGLVPAFVTLGVPITMGSYDRVVFTYLNKVLRSAEAACVEGECQ